jgi:hypothetical protein
MGWTNKASEFDSRQKQETSFHTVQTGLRRIKLQMLFIGSKRGVA